MFTAIRLASSLVSSFAADPRPRLFFDIYHDEGGIEFFDGPGWRKAAVTSFLWEPDRQEPFLR